MYLKRFLIDRVSISGQTIVVNLRPIAPGTERLVPLFSYLLVSTGERLKDELSFLVYLGPLRELPPRRYVRPKAPEPGRWASGLAADPRSDRVGAAVEDDARLVHTD